MYNSIIVENLMNPRAQALRHQWMMIQLLNQSSPRRAVMLKTTHRLILEVMDKNLRRIALVKLNLSWKRNKAYRRG